MSRGQLHTENRTGSNVYASTYTYNPRGLRVTAFRSEGGVTSHNGTYTYDAAGRLTTVSDTVSTSGLAGTYTWYADGTLSSYPGPGYTRQLEYDEEGRLISITRDFASAPDVLAYEYGYGFDGQRRWRKDHITQVWDWFPCGVACDAGELVELRSTNGGQSWSAQVNQLRAGKALVRRGSEFHLSSIGGRASLVLDSSGTLVGRRIQDRDGLRRVETGTASSPVGTLVSGEEGLSLTDLGSAKGFASLPASTQSGTRALCETLCKSLVCGLDPLKKIPTDFLDLCKELLPTPPLLEPILKPCDVFCRWWCSRNNSRAPGTRLAIAYCRRHSANYGGFLNCCAAACQRMWPRGGQAREWCNRTCSTVLGRCSTVGGGNS